MPNVLGTLVSALIVQRALELVYTKRPILKRIAKDVMDYETGEVTAKFNQTITTRTRTVATVNNFGTGAVDRADVDVSVALSNFKEIHAAFTPQEYTGTSRDLIDESAEPMAVAFANHMVDAVAALWFATATYTNQTIKGAGWDYRHLTQVRKKLNAAGRGVPQPNRFYVANGDVWESLLNDPLIIAEYNNSRNQNAISTGELPEVAGFGLMEYPELPATNNLAAFAGVPNATIYVHRVPKDPREVLPNTPFPGNLGIVQDPKTGLSVMVNEWIEPATLKANVRLVWMYGVDEGITGNGERIVTAAP
jgi:hypothetical protein